MKARRKERKVQNVTLGEKIRNLRAQNGMTMEELAQHIGVQRSAVNKYEKGIVVNLKRETIAALARTFQVSPSYFLEDDDPISQEEHALITAYRAADAGTQASVRKLLDLPEEKNTAESAIS